jgi:peptide-methionine (S)-S-oxide reductase
VAHSEPLGPAKLHIRGGCFWGVQELLRRRDGVSQDRLRPGRISYRDILEFFFQIHDPTTKYRQGNDFGSDYRSEISCTSVDG